MQFKYHPDYLDGKKREYETPTETSLDLAKKHIRESLMQSPDFQVEPSVVFSPIVADGGNFTFATIKEGDACTPVLIMTEKIFSENKNLPESEIKAELKKLFPNYKIVYLPWYEKDECGHTDGLVHAVAPNKLLVNFHGYPAPVADEMRKRLEEAGFELIHLKLSDYPENSWAYVNMLHTQNVIIVPGLELPVDVEALAQIEELFPEYKGRIFQVQMKEIIEKYGGALNCLSWTFII